MFEDVLKSNFQKIFKMDRVTFQRPSEDAEQECLFIEIENSRNTFRDGKEVARVTGNIHIFAPQEKLPYGYFSKCISSADKALTKDLFFHSFEDNQGTYLDLSQRKAAFVFLYDSQHDPNLGTLNELTLEQVE